MTFDLIVLITSRLLLSTVASMEKVDLSEKNSPSTFRAVMELEKVSNKPKTKDTIFQSKRVC